MFAKPLYKRSLYQPLPMNLQYFSAKDDDPEDDSEGKDETPSLEELLENPEFKKQYEADMKTKLGKRLKKYKDVDLDEYKRLKEEAGKKEEKPEKDEESDDPSKSKIDEHEKRLARAERKEKRAAIKEYAMDNKFNAKLSAKLIDIDELELDEDGEPTNLEELFEDLAEEFPDLFGEKDEEEEEEVQESEHRPRYNPGKSKGNKVGKKDARKAGAERAKARHKKEEE